MRSTAHGAHMCICPSCTVCILICADMYCQCTSVLVHFAALLVHQCTGACCHVRPCTDSNGLRFTVLPVLLQVMATSTTSNVLYNRQQSAASDPSLAGLAGLRGSTGDGGTQGMPGGIHHAASRDLMDVPGSLSMQQARPTLHAMRLSGQPPALRASSEVPAAESTVTSQNGNAQHANSGMLVIDGTDTGDMCGTQWVGDLGRPTGPSSPTPDPSASGHRTHHSTTASAVTNSSRLPLPPMQLGSCASFAHRGKTSEAGNGAAAVTPLSRTVSDAGALASMVGSPSSKPLPAVGVHAGPRVNGRPGSQMGPGTSGHHGPSASELQGHLARHHEQVILVVNNYTIVILTCLLLGMAQAVRASNALGGALLASCSLHLLRYVRTCFAVISGRARLRGCKLDVALMWFLQLWCRR